MYAQIDYGLQTPETFDRYGVTQEYRIWGRNGDDTAYEHIVPQPSMSAIHRLGLRLVAWASHRYHGYWTYRLKAHGRDLTLKCYADGRIKIDLDGRQVYGETIKVVTRNWIKHKVLVEEYDDEVVIAEAQHRRTPVQRRIEAAEARLREKRQR